MNSYQKRTALANYKVYCTTRNKQLSDCYSNYSFAKARAWEYCRHLCDKYNGCGLSVISYNSFIFTAGFLYIDENMYRHFVYITPSYDVDIIPVI